MDTTIQSHDNILSTKDIKLKYPDIIKYEMSGPYIKLRCMFVHYCHTFIRSRKLAVLILKKIVCEIYLHSEDLRYS